MATLYERLNALCQNKGIKGGRMCTDLGISKSLMTDLKSGRKKSVNAETAQKIASYFGVTVAYLLGEPSQPTSANYHSSLKGYRPVPVLSVYETPEENPVKYLIGEEALPLSNEDENEYVGLKISDDAMSPSLLPGDTVIIKKQSIAEDGDLVLCKLDAAPAIIRQIKKESSGICLIPRNPLSETVFISNTEADRLTLCGIVIELRRTIKI